MERKYEILLLLKPELTKEELSGLITNIETKIGGKVKSKEEWGVKELAYRIGKDTKAFYVHYYVETTPEAIVLLKELIAVEKKIIRPMILRHEKEWPSDMKTSKDLKFPERKPRPVRSNDSRPRRPEVNKVEADSTTVKKEVEKSND